jgi:hypothetical protein
MKLRKHSMNGRGTPKKTEQGRLAFLRFLLLLVICLAFLTGTGRAQTEQPAFNRLDEVPWAPDSCPAVCGDFGGDEEVTLEDLALLFEYLFTNQLPPNTCITRPENLDLDSFLLANVRDAAYLSRYLLHQPAAAPSCPATFPEYEPLLDTEDTLSIPLGIILPAFDSSIAVSIRYNNSDSLYALALPLKMSVSGQTPLIDSVVLGTRSQGADLAAATIDSAQGTINFGLHWFDGLASGKDTLLTVHLTISPAAHDRLVRIDTISLPPDNHTLFVRYPDLEGRVPTLVNFGPIPLYVQAHSPVNLIVTDPIGDSIGATFNTISGATYSIFNDSVYIPEVLLGHYYIEVVKDPDDQSGDSSYSVDARVDGTADQVLAAAAPVPQGGQAHNYIITAEPSTPECLSKPGDANGNGLLNLVDIISIVNYIAAKTACAPVPDCWLWGLNCRGDWNADGLITLTDAVWGVNYLFGKPGGPWYPVTSGACCLSVL